MAKTEHVDLLSSGVEAWNEWRQNNPHVEPDLGDVNLQHAKLSGVDFSKATLSRANLRDAELSKCSFRGARLDYADFRNAVVADTDFRDLSEGENSSSDRHTQTTAISLGGADLSNAKLPDSLGDFKTLLSAVAELSASAKKIFLSILLGCAYALLTIATTDDARLLTNLGLSPLPIIGSQVPVVAFYWVAPVLLFFLYIYQHLYLQRLWDALARLPAVFPDGTPVNVKIYPWLLNGLVCVRFKRLSDKRPPFSRLQARASTLLAWYVVPFTMSCFWLRFLFRHDWVGTWFHSVRQRGRRHRRRFGELWRGRQPP